MKCEVTGAIGAGKSNKVISAGTWMMPPPLPRMLDRKPAPKLSSRPQSREKV